MSSLIDLIKTLGAAYNINPNKMISQAKSDEVRQLLSKTDISSFVVNKPTLSEIRFGSALFGIITNKKVTLTHFGKKFFLTEEVLFDEKLQAPVIVLLNNQLNQHPPQEQPVALLKRAYQNELPLAFHGSTNSFVFLAKDIPDGADKFMSKVNSERFCHGSFLGEISKQRPDVQLKCSLVKNQQGNYKFLKFNLDEVSSLINELSFPEIKLPTNYQKPLFQVMEHIGKYREKDFQPWDNVDFKVLDIASSHKFFSEFMKNVDIKEIFNTLNQIKTNTILNQIKALGKKSEQKSLIQSLIADFNALNNNKGSWGLIVESLIGLEANNRSEKDTQNWELKSAGLKPNGDFKEDLFITMIDYDSVAASDFKNSHLYNKLEKILFLTFMTGPHGEKFISDCRLLDLDDSENSQWLETFENDYNKIRNIIINDPESLSMSSTETLVAKTKGAGGSAAKTRAFYLRCIKLSLIFPKKFTI